MIRLYKITWWTIITLVCAIPLAISGAVLYLSHDLPSIDSIRQTELQIPLRVYSADDKLIAEFGEMRRSPIEFTDIPPRFIDALLSAEDDNFESHYGIDLKSLLRAVVELVSTGHKQTGGSTITMQVAKNYFLSSEQTYIRKAKEILLALRLEQELTKKDILELYVNKIFLGYRSYGIEAAAQVYYGKSIKELSLAQMAMLAGLPKAPSTNNPIINPQRSLERRNWILARMHALGKINKQEYETARAEPETAKRHDAVPDLAAPYIAEMVRSEMFETYGEAAYTEGFHVKTTVTTKLQEAANAALRAGLMTYDERHGYRGPERKQIPQDDWQKILKQQKIIGPLEPAIVTEVNAQDITVLTFGKKIETVKWASMRWARPYFSANSMGAAPRSPSSTVKVGDLIRIKRDKEGNPLFSQIPEAEATIISLNPASGSIEALVGGFSFEQSNYNRATQAKRQPGSSFKPFIYSAALDAGFTASSLVNDAPIVIDDGRTKWRPKNDSNTFLGPISLREGLYRSRNLVTIRLLQSIGIDYALDYISKFGFIKENLPPSLSLSLGSADVTPMQIARAWAVFANGGYRVRPYVIAEIKDRNDRVVFTAVPPTVPSTKETLQPNMTASIIPTEADDRAESTPAIAESVIDPRTAFIMTSILQDVVKRGTGWRARAMGRTDLAGKTGTTNETKDTWFTGYNADFATIVWVGFDQPKTLGRREYGGTLALPIWIDFMSIALKDKPNHSISRPEGIVQLGVDAANGRLASSGSARTYGEFFKKEDTIRPVSTGTAGGSYGSESSSGSGSTSGSGSSAPSSGGSMGRTPSNAPLSSDDVAPMDLF